MGSKPIQDVAPPKAPARTTALPDSSTGPEFVSNIPVRAPSGQATLVDTSTSSFIVSEEKKPDIAQNPVPAQAKNNAASQNKVVKPKPTAAILFACLSLTCLAIGGYLSFLAEG